jgi:hypothetical protein
VANNIAFLATGKTYLLTVTTTSANVAVYADTPANQFALYNDGNHEIFVKTGASSGTTAVIPTSGTGEYGFVVPPNSRIVITNGQANGTNPVYFAAIVDTGTHNLYITPGEGMS